MINNKNIAILGIKGIPAKGGAERVVESLIPFIIQKQYQMTIYCRKDFSPGNISIKGVKLVRIPTINIGFLGFIIYHLLSSFHCIIFGNFSLLHLHNVESAITLPLLKLKYPIIFTSHGRVYDTNKWPKLINKILFFCEYIFLKKANLKTCPSLALTNYYNKKRIGSKVLYIPNGVRLASIEQADNPDYENEIHKIGLATNRYIISATNRILKTKGIEDLIDAYIFSSISIPLIIFGDWKNSLIEFNRLKNKVKENNIILHDRISGELLWKIINNSLIFIFPSYVETMSMMLLEAAAIAVPIIYAHIPNNSALLQEYDVSFKPEDIKDLSDKILLVLKKYEYYKEKSIIRSHMIKSNYDWNIISNIYIQYYSEIERSKQ